MPNEPSISLIGDKCKYWTHTFEAFRVKVFVPEGHPLKDKINFGFSAPYLIVFEDCDESAQTACNYAQESGLMALAREFSTSVVFVYPTNEGGWDRAPEDLFTRLIAETRIHQYYGDGFVHMRAPFTKEWGEYYLRGAVFRSCLYARGRAADYIAKNCLKTLQGEYLWGPGEITPLAATLEGLSVVPHPERRDIPIVSVGNSEEINAALRTCCERLRVREKAENERDYHEFIGRLKRWCGALQEEPVMDEYGMTEEFGCARVKTSDDNRGDEAGTPQHDIGYIAYYRKDLFKNGKVPLLIVFHGGGDSALHICHVSGWWRVAFRHGFLLVAVENHLNSTATETVEFIQKLTERYPIDETRIYASGFSMGGCKSWDLYQEYPRLFAALAPMDATFEVGLNVYGEKAPCPINRDTPVPVFYAGGEQTPLPELPCQAQKCTDRIRYLFEVNRVKKPYNADYALQSAWEEKIWGVRGDTTQRLYDASRDSVLTIHLFESTDGVSRTALASINPQGHECREHTCEQAWLFMSRFSREKQAQL